MFLEYFKLALRNLKNRALRSWLTVLGIVMGVFLVVSLLSFSEGIPESIRQMLRQIGGDVIMVLPGGGYDLDTMMGIMAGRELSGDDVEAIKRARGTDLVLEVPWRGEQVRWQDKSELILIWGLDFQEGSEMIRYDMGWTPSEGDYPRPGRREVILGHLVSENIFPGIEVGDEISVRGKRFTVSGILMSLGHRENDNTVVFNIDEYRDVTGEREGAVVAMARVEEGYDIDMAIRNIETSLEERALRRRGEEDESSYGVFSSESMIEMVERVLGVIQGGIIALSAIAILVGAIGIMNTMFTSVGQRVKEIGILKAVGAKRKSIIGVFLMEAGLIGLVGGIIGLILGLLASHLAAYLVSMSPGVIVSVEAQTSPQLIIGTLIFSFLLGCLSGFLPAKRASDLKPVDALMYE